MLYSILLATLDRTKEVEQFLRSLAQQTLNDFELVVVDQNRDDRLQDILMQYSSSFPILHLRCARGHSRAFNAGLKHTRGEIVAFPDDDCWYDPDLLERVATLLKTDPACSGVTGREVVEAGFASGGRWDSTRGALTRSNIFRRAISFSIFLRQGAAKQYAFDETLGVGAGTPWGAGEESDYLLRMIEDGHRIVYDPSVTIWHQGRSGPYTEQTFSKARSYARGMGRVLRKHHYPFASVTTHLVRPLGGVVHSMTTGRVRKARYHWSIFAGRLDGWLGKPEPAREPIRGGLVSSREDLS